MRLVNSRDRLVPFRVGGLDRTIVLHPDRLLVTAVSDNHASARAVKLHVDHCCVSCLFHGRTGCAVRLDIFRPGRDGTGTGRDRRQY